jgi:hypothetical protein
MAPAILDLCEGDSNTGYVAECSKPIRTRFLSSRLASSTLVEERDSALPRAETSRKRLLTKQRDAVIPAMLRAAKRFIVGWTLIIGMLLYATMLSLIAGGRQLCDHVAIVAPPRR